MLGQERLQHAPADVAGRKRRAVPCFKQAHALTLPDVSLEQLDRCGVDVDRAHGVVRLRLELLPLPDRTSVTRSACSGATIAVQPASWSGNARSSPAPKTRISASA